ncbi:MAG: glycosylase [Planctomycetes bacterium]|nr:glycosylase [Planctomycetota bacterium]
MHRWNKKGLIFQPVAWPRWWLAEFAQAPCTLAFDDFVRVYFSGRPAPDAAGQYVSYSGFVDLDRSDLTRVLRVSEQPIFPLGATGEFDEFGTYPVSVCREGDQVVAYYGGWTRCEAVPFDVAIGRAVSYDGGVTFRKSGRGPVLGFSPDEPFILSGPKVRRFQGRWQLWYIAGRKWLVHEGRPEPVYKIRMASSDDGITWDKDGRDLIPDRLGPEEAQASPDVFQRDSTWHMFFCYRHGTGYRGRERGYRIGYATSRDMREWIRADDFAGLDVSDAGWDSEMVSYPHVFELDGQVHMLYLGNAVGRQGFGLATLEGLL